MNEHRVTIQKPIITEKATLLRENNKYVFKVDPRANKVQIRKAVESIFDVHVTSVRTLSVPSKPKRQGLFQGKTSGWKKAIVTLRRDDSIEVIQ